MLRSEQNWFNYDLEKNVDSWYEVYVSVCMNIMFATYTLLTNVVCDGFSLKKSCHDMKIRI